MPTTDPWPYRDSSCDAPSSSTQTPRPALASSCAVTAPPAPDPITATSTRSGAGTLVLHDLQRRRRHERLDRARSLVIREQRDAPHGAEQLTEERDPTK